MFRRLSMFSLAVFGVMVASASVQAQESTQSGSQVQYQSGPLYAWSTYMSFTSTANPIYVGELITNRPFVATRRRLHSTPSSNGTWTSSIPVPVTPAPGGC